MATGVVFGQPRSLLLQPGAYSLVDASALNLPQGFAYNLVAILGAGVGGTPMLPYYLNDPIEAQQIFGTGTPLADAVRFAFQGGANGGAPVVIAVRIDNCAQSSGTLVPVTGASLAGTFKDYGAYGNTYSLSFYQGSAQGTMAVVQGKFLDGRSYYYKIDNETSFGRLVERITNETPIDVSILSGGVRASQTITIATSQTDGRATLIDAQTVTQTTQAYCYQYPASLLPNTTDSMVVSFNSPIAWSIASIDVTADTFTASAATTLVDGNLVKLSAGLATGVNGNSTYVVQGMMGGTTFSVAELIANPASWAVSALDIATDTLTAPGNALANGDAVKLTGGTLPTGIAANRLYFVRDKAGDTFKLAATLSGTAIDLTGTINNVGVVRVAGARVDISGVIGANPRVISNLGTSRITGSVPSEFNGTRSPAAIRPGYTQTLNNCTVSSAAYTSDSARFTLAAGESWGNIAGNGKPGSVFTIPSGTYVGTYQILHYEWDGYGQDRVRIVRKLTGDRKVASGSLTATLTFFSAVDFGRPQPATEALESQTPGYGVLTRGGQYITIVVGDKTVYYSTQPGDSVDTLSEVLTNMINKSSDMPVIASYVYNPGTYTATITLQAKTPGVVANQYAVNVLMNVQTLLLATIGGQNLTGGVDPLPPTNAQGEVAGTLILSGGYDSAPTYQRWLDGIETVKYLPVRWIVPTTDNIGVQMALSDHCQLMSSTPKRRERMAVMGHGLGWTPAQVRARSETFQSERVVFVSPGLVTADNVTGLPRSYSSVYTAAIVAGMLAAEGNGISDPITHTYMRNVVRLEYEYRPGSIELDSMIESGVLTIERDPALTRPSRGFRVTRALTTWRVSVNSSFKSNVFESISVVNQSDYVAARVREMEEALFIGQAIFPDTLESIRIAVNLELQRHVRERVIYGYEPKFTRIALNSDSRNAVDVTYKIYPAPALEFILNSQLLFPIPEEQSVAPAGSR